MNRRKVIFSLLSALIIIFITLICVFSFLYAKALDKLNTADSQPATQRARSVSLAELKDSRGEVNTLWQGGGDYWFCYFGSAPSKLADVADEEGEIFVVSEDSAILFYSEMSFRTNKGVVSFSLKSLCVAREKKNQVLEYARDVLTCLNNKPSMVSTVTAVLDVFSAERNLLEEQMQLLLRLGFISHISLCSDFDDFLARQDLFDLLNKDDSKDLLTRNFMTNNGLASFSRMLGGKNTSVLKKQINEGKQLLCMTKINATKGGLGFGYFNFATKLHKALVSN